MAYNNDPNFIKFVNEVEKLMPELSDIEKEYLKKYYKYNISPIDTVNDLLNFNKSNTDKFKRISDNRIKYFGVESRNSNFDFEDD